jgi:hypothetical protein
VDKLARRLMQEREQVKQMRLSARAAERRLETQPETPPVVVSVQHQAELDVRSAKILELERTLFETYRVREATGDEAAAYVENLQKEVVHLAGMVRTVGGSPGFISLKFIHSLPSLPQTTERERILLQKVESKNERMEMLDYQVARYEDLLAGEPLPPEVRRYLDPQIVIDVKKVMRRVRQRIRAGE